VLVKTPLCSVGDSWASCRRSQAASRMWRPLGMASRSPFFSSRALDAHAFGQARLQPAERVGAARARPRVAGVEDEGDMRVLARQFIDEQRQFLVRQVVAAGQPAVGADQAFVEPAEVELAEGAGRERLRAVAAVLEQRHVARSYAAQVLAELPDDVGARGLAVLQHLHRQPVGAGSGRRRSRSP
jgi:hypothetical protein